MSIENLENENGTNSQDGFATNPNECVSSGCCGHDCSEGGCHQPDPEDKSPEEKTEESSEAATETTGDEPTNASSTDEASTEGEGDTESGIEDFIRDLHEFAEKHHGVLVRAIPISAFVGGEPCPKADTCDAAENCPMSGKGDYAEEDLSVEDMIREIFHAQDVVLQRIQALEDNMDNMIDDVMKIVGDSKPLPIATASGIGMPMRTDLSRDAYKSLERMINATVSNVVKKERKKAVKDIVKKIKEFILKFYVNHGC